MFVLLDTVKTTDFEVETLSVFRFHLTSMHTWALSLSKIVIVIPLAEVLVVPLTRKNLFARGKSRGGQRYFFGGCAFASMLPFFLRPLALDCNDFKFASVLSAIPL